MSSVYDVVEQIGDAPQCQCCPRVLQGEELAAGRTVCRRCENVMAGRLGEVLQMWPQVNAMDRRSGSRRDSDNGPRGSGPDGSAAPGDLDVIALAAGDVAGRLEPHEDAWRTALHWTARPRRGRPDPRVRGTIRFLQDTLVVACSSTAEVWRLDDELRRLVAQMQAVITGERTRRTTLPQTCPYIALGWDDGTTDAPPCGGTLRMDPKRQSIRCDTCRTDISMDRWLELGLLAGAIAIQNPDEESAA